MFLGMYAWFLILVIYHKLQSNYLASKQYNVIKHVLWSMIITIIVGIAMVNIIHSILS